VELAALVFTDVAVSLFLLVFGAAFGSIIGLMAFFYFFARLTLFCAAWIATAAENETLGSTLHN
jgi:membrane protein